jgi:hypothetical protein
LDECRSIAVSSLSRDIILAPAASVTLSILVLLFATGFDAIGLFGREAPERRCTRNRPIQTSDPICESGSSYEDIYLAVNESVVGP